MQKNAVKELRKKGEEVSVESRKDPVSIKSIISEAINTKLENAIISGVSHATEDNDVGTHSHAQPTDASTIQSQGTRRKASAGSVGNFLSNKKLQISFKPNPN